MKHYFSAPFKKTECAEYWEEPMILSGLSVFDPDSTPYSIGLLDKDGTPIMVQEIMDQIGYIRR